MEIVRTQDYERMRRRLPTGRQRLCTTQEARFMKNPKDALLHIKKLKGMEGVFSIRVSREYRILFYLHTEDVAVFFALGHRKDVYRR